MTNPDQPKHHQFFWFDCETTGLDPYTDHILEWALVLADDDGPECTFAPIEQYTSVVRHMNARNGPGIDPFVIKMHTTNGLWAACDSPEAPTLSDGEDFLLEIVDEMIGPRGTIMLAGNSVHFDLGFLRIHMPRFAARCSHRVFDVSTLKTEAMLYGTGATFTSTTKHRALDDALDSLRAASEIIRRKTWGARWGETNGTRRVVS